MNHILCYFVTCAKGIFLNCCQNVRHRREIRWAFNTSFFVFRCCFDAVRCIFRFFFGTIEIQDQKQKTHFQHQQNALHTMALNEKKTSILEPLANEKTTKNAPSFCKFFGKNINSKWYTSKNNKKNLQIIRINIKFRLKNSIYIKNPQILHFKIFANTCEIYECATFCHSLFSKEIS